MHLRITSDYLDLFKDNFELHETLSILKDKEFKDISEFEATINLILKTYTPEIRNEVLAKLLIVDDDDTRQEEQFENGTIYPYDPTKADIDIREDPQTVFELVIRKWDQHKLVLDPEFQRNYVWKEAQQSLFIESVILNFPLPPMYINKNKKGQYIVVDGRQRLTTLRSFLKDEFKLEGLRALPQLNGKNFSELTGFDNAYQTKIEDKKLLVYLIQPSVPLEMVYDIFNRINTGGTQLQRQEIRNCIYMGRSTELLKKLASKNYFRKAIDNGISPIRKKDQEAILRYVSFKIQHYIEDYTGSMNDFVENAMKKINHQFDDYQVKELEVDFERVMRRTFEFFGSANFRIPTESTRGRINLAVLESVSYFFSSQTDEFLDSNKERIKTNFDSLLSDPVYNYAVRSSTSDPQRVKTRFEKAMSILGEI